MNSYVSELITMVSSAGPIVKGVMLVLLFFSVISWAIIFIKFIYLRKAHSESWEFTELFWQCRTLTDAFSKAKALDSSPAARIFMAAYMEMARDAGKGTGDKKKTLGLHGISNVKRSLERSINTEVRKLNQLIPFLATAGNTSPFIGLFGTVWGIMGTFHGIGQSGSASLAVVAPGISEALVATAAGLAVAIPSVIAYNYFLDRIRGIHSELNSFSADLLNIVERDIQKQTEESCV